MDVVFRNIALGISLAAPIGPASIAVIQTGLTSGFLAAFLTGVGVTMADTTYLLVVFFGVSRFLDVAAVRVSLQLMGALVLAYLGFRTIRAARTARHVLGGGLLRTGNPVIVGYMVNISNPIAIVWWLAVFGSLLAEAGPASARFSALALSSPILVGILLWHSTASLLSHWGRRILTERYLRFMSMAAGIALLLFSLRFLYGAIVEVTGL